MEIYVINSLNRITEGRQTKTVNKDDKEVVVDKDWSVLVDVHGLFG